MSIADQASYLSEISGILRSHWPENRTVNIVCHGHSVPAGYFATPMVDTMNAYPYLLHLALKHRFPFAVMNVIVSAIGGENSASGAERFERDVLCHRPDVVIIDYGLNDRGMGLERSRECWSRMIEASLRSGSKLLLLTPTPDTTQASAYEGEDRGQLGEHADQIRQLAADYGVGLADSLSACLDYSATADLSDILSWSNHPNRTGHELVTKELLRWFPAG
ncbi:MAG: SGNH/GDSL hydrolase family protein [Kiritimatiellia bacterium]|jgi:lysophospholipase L1-like esterase|nr:SGNH/GDSL hydrolase family protein [Kiritimatiellia bacterium]MDP6630346.1 SGNH/GDSL hydrolase family protein [Kiritimatiellia bacterium]MDP6810852.1 SGNH/GDSL hydrolase family protein [Kiritimatiellia bacterium]MDP7024195.1 SGNH/GDSL hydrolase family protein [Kiritimatiellia bacterium]